MKFTLKEKKEAEEANDIMRQIWVKRASDQSTAGTPRKYVSVQNTIVDRSSVRNVLSTEDWDLVLKGAKTITTPKDGIIISQGEEYQRIYQITKGVCRTEASGL